MNDVCLNQGEFWHSSPVASIAVKTAKDADGMLWYIPDNLEGLWQDYSKTVKAEVNQPVGYLPDWTNEFDLFFYTEDFKRPIIREDSKQSKYLEFDGTKAIFTDKDFYVDGFLNDFSLCFAGNISSNSGIILGNYDAVSYNTFFIGSTAQGNISVGCANAVFDLGIPWGTDMKVISVLKTGNAVKVRVNQELVLQEELPVTVRPNIDVQFRDFLETLDYPVSARMHLQFMSFNTTAEQDLIRIENLGKELIRDQG